MTFDFLYNRDNGIAYPFTGRMAEDRRDLVAVTEAELRRIVRGSDINEILGERIRNSMPDVSISIKTQEDVVDTRQDARETAQDASEEKKGIVVPSGFKCEETAPADVFGNVQKDYTAMRGKVVPSDVDLIPDSDLIRFMREVADKDYGECPYMEGEEADSWYALIRGKARKLIERLAKGRDRKRRIAAENKAFAKEAGNVGND